MVYWFHEKVVDTNVECLCAYFRVRLCRQKQQRQSTTGLVLAQDLCYFHPIGLRHVHVKDHKVGFKFQHIVYDLG